MFVLLVAAALFYPAQTCFTKKDGRDPRDFYTGLEPPAEDDLNTTGDRHKLHEPGPHQNELAGALTQRTHQSQKRKNSDELSAKRNEILRRVYELPPLFNYYDILLRNENDMENKRTHGLLPNYLSYPRYF